MSGLASLLVSPLPWIGWGLALGLIVALRSQRAAYLDLRRQIDALLGSTPAASPTPPAAPSRILPVVRNFGLGASRDE